MDNGEKRYGSIMINTLFQKRVEYSPYSNDGVVVMVDKDRLKVLNSDSCLMTLLHGVFKIEDVFVVAKKSIDGTLFLVTWFFEGPACCATAGIAREITRTKPGFTVEDIGRLERFLGEAAFLDAELPRSVKAQDLRGILWRR